MGVERGEGREREGGREGDLLLLRSGSWELGMTWLWDDEGGTRNGGEGGGRVRACWWFRLGGLGALFDPAPEVKVDVRGVNG